MAIGRKLRQVLELSPADKLEYLVRSKSPRVSFQHGRFSWRRGAILAFFRTILKLPRFALILFCVALKVASDACFNCSLAGSRRRLLEERASSVLLLRSPENKRVCHTNDPVVTLSMIAPHAPSRLLEHCSAFLFVFLHVHAFFLLAVSPFYTSTFLVFSTPRVVCLSGKR